MSTTTTTTTTPAINTYLLALARVLMSSLFVWDGVVQLRSPAGTAAYFASLGIPMPGVTVWVSIAVHLLGGLAILVGYKTRWAAAVLLLLCLGTAFGVHLLAGDAETASRDNRRPQREETSPCRRCAPGRRSLQNMYRDRREAGTWWQLPLSRYA